MDGGWSYDSEEEAAAAGEPWPHTCQGSAPPGLGLMPGAGSVLPSLLAEIPVLLALLCFCPTLKSAEKGERIL